MKNKMAKAIGSWLLILVITLALLEVVLRLFDMLPVHRNPLSGFHSPDSTLGWIGTPNYHGRFKSIDFDIIIEHDEMGLRRATRETRSIDSDAEHIVFLGDSFTWGWGVENDEVFTEQLQNRLGDAAQIHNFGVNAYSTAQELLMLEKHALLTEPDTVVVMFFSNDLNENTDAKEGRRPWFELIDNELQPRNQPVKRPSVGAFKLFMQRSVALSQLKHAFYQIRDSLEGKEGNKPAAELPQESYSEEKWRLLNALLKELQTRCKEATPVCQLQIVYIPTREEVITFKAHGTSAIASRVGAICDAAGIRFLDLSRGLYKVWQDSAIGEPDATPIYLPVDGHWDVAGHAAVANILFDSWQNDNH